MCDIFYLLHYFYYRNVESAVAKLTPPPGPFDLGNTAYLSQETTPERQALYPQLVNSYRWMDKVSYIVSLRYIAF